VRPVPSLNYIVLPGLYVTLILDRGETRRENSISCGHGHPDPVIESFKMCAGGYSRRGTAMTTTRSQVFRSICATQPRRSSLWISKATVVALVDTRWVRRRVYHLQTFVAVNQSIALDDSVRHRVADGELAVVARVVAQHNRGGHRARVRRAAIVSSTHREAADATSIDTVR